LHGRLAQRLEHAGKLGDKAAQLVPYQQQQYQEEREERADEEGKGETESQGLGQAATRQPPDQALDHERQHAAAISAPARRRAWRSGAIPARAAQQDHRFFLGEIAIHPFAHGIDRGAPSVAVGRRASAARTWDAVLAGAFQQLVAALLAEHAEVPHRNRPCSARTRSPGPMPFNAFLAFSSGSGQDMPRASTSYIDHPLPVPPCDARAI
jgi:hypothetical protein